MAPLEGGNRMYTGAELVRHELLLALHLGRLHPGERVPSVRRLAQKTGVNRKTVHRAYARLAREGFLDLRPGSGTFISERTSGDDRLSAGSLLAAANRTRAAAASLGLSPERFARFLTAYLDDGLRDRPLLVAECNGEQACLIAYELHARLGVRARPVLLEQLSVEQRAVQGDLGIVTTDCHRFEVEALARPWRVPVYRVAFDPEFPRKLVARAHEGGVVMVVRDAAFAPVFLRLLRQMSVPQQLLARIHVTEVDAARRLLRERSDVAALYVSPTVSGESLGLAAEGLPRIHGRWRVETGAMDRLRVRLAFEASSSDV